MKSFVYIIGINIARGLSVKPGISRITIFGETMSRKIWPAAFFAALVLVGIQPALATASVDVRALWTMSPDGQLPDGVSLLCTGGCFHELDLNEMISHGSVQYSLEDLSDISIVNDSDSSFADVYFPFTIGVSAFNPGGSEIGVMVDNPFRESASFSSFVNVFDFASDFHGCQTSVAQPACGVSSPDESDFEFYALLPGPHETENLGDAVISIDANLQSVPEPTSIVLLLGGLFIVFALAGMGRRVAA